MTVGYPGEHDEPGRTELVIGQGGLVLGAGCPNLAGVEVAPVERRGPALDGQHLTGGLAIGQYERAVEGEGPAWTVPGGRLAMTDGGWFEDVDPDDVDAAAEAIGEGSAEVPADWPVLAVEAGFAADEAGYYERLHAAAVRAARDAAAERERAPDRQLAHAVRAMDDCARTANELAERVAEWAGSCFGEDGAGVEYAREVARREPADATEERVVGLAGRVADLASERDRLRSHVETEASRVAPNLSALAGPVLAARLIALAGGLESLARMPSGTVQVLGAEDALFAHLAGRAPSPKHGVIYTHEYVRGTAKDRRGSAARALAGKLTIAARVDHYSGERKPEIDADLDARIERIRSGGG